LEIAEKALSATDSLHLKEKNIDELSAGERQRVIVARALAQEPVLLFLDEPTSGLDVQSVLIIRDLIRKLNQEGLTIFITTHNMEEASQMCNRVAIINQGKIAAIDTPEKLKTAEGVILPGVGAFGDGMSRLEQRGFIEPLKRYAAGGKPLLGICLGMQFLFSRSEEFGMHNGLDLIGGEVVRLPRAKIRDEFNYKIPHIGWNGLLKPSGAVVWPDTILDGIDEHAQAYFLHSFAAVPEDSSNILAHVGYGGNLVAAVVKKGNIYGCQFHPEKSRGTGIRILRNFVNIVRSRYDNITARSGERA